MAYPYYMRKQRRAGITATELNEADQIRQRLIEISQRRGCGVHYYTDEQGRHMARIGRVDGVGVGFIVSAEQVGALAGK